MNKKMILALCSVAVLQTCAVAATTIPVAATSVTNRPATVEMDPKVIFTDNNLGNCLACHAVVKHPDMVAGNIAPPFVAMKTRFPDVGKLKAIIYDEQVNNPDTIMPPFGRNKVLTPEQIDAVANYILQF
ncbi:MAG: sulfur oxidation c-type cytochrome SoxX [Herbaspirillum sp.]